LTYRAKAPKNRSLMRVILDSTLRTPSDARLFRTKPGGPVLIFCRRNLSDIRRAELERQGAEIVGVPHSEHELDLVSILQELGKRGVLGLLVEGGSSVHWSFVSRHLVDKFLFIIAPLVLGGKNSVPSIGGKGYAGVGEALKFKLRKSYFIGPDMILEFYPSCSKSIISPWISQESAPSPVRYFSPASGRK
jgi:diaminohydroxyphosphoribosylaminopyrimidine deaminase/5-amino-6-(5-phosphoribosylamino)uracil reductase